MWSATRRTESHVHGLRCSGRSVGFPTKDQQPIQSPKPHPFYQVELALFQAWDCEYIFTKMIEGI
jgi:hypothetical protein